MLSLGRHAVAAETCAHDLSPGASHVGFFQISAQPWPAVCCWRLMSVYSGVEQTARTLDGTAGYIAAGGLPMADVLAVAVALFELDRRGCALAVGFHARWAALALGVLHPAGQRAAPQVLGACRRNSRWSQQLMFLKNMAVAGGMFIVAGPGCRPGQRRQPQRRHDSPSRAELTGRHASGEPSTPTRSSPAACCSRRRSRG